MDPKQPANVPPGASRFPAEAGRIASIEDRQLGSIEYLARMERGQSDLAGAGKVQPVFLHLIGFFLVTGEMAGGDEGLRPGQRRHGHQGEAVLGDDLLGPEHQSLLEQRQAALQRIHSRAGDPGDPRQVRPVVHLDQSDMVARLEIEAGRLPFGANHRVEALVRPDRRPFPGDVRDPKHQRVQFRRFLGKRAFGLIGLGTEGLGPGAERRTLGRIGGLEARADLVALPPELVDPGLELAYLAVEREQAVEVERRILPLRRLAHGIGILSDELEAEHGGGLAADRLRGKASALG